MRMSTVFILLAGVVSAYGTSPIRRCVQDGVAYKEGEGIPDPDPCTQCMCYRGRPLCASSLCLAPPMPHPDCKLKFKPGVCCPTEFECPSDIVTEIPPLPTPTTTTTSAPTTTSGGYTDQPTTVVFEATLKCEYNEQLYMEGEDIPDGEFCSKCRCVMGNITCEERRCPSAPGGNCEMVEDPWNCCPTYKCMDANYPETASQPGEEAETAVSDDEGDVIGEYVTEVEENPEMTIINSRDRTIMMPTGALSVSGHHPEMAPEDGSSTDGGAAWKLSGCVDGAGRMYEIGERMTISGDPCEMCRCHDNGKPLCAMASCAGPPSRYCRAIYTADNTCCPEWDCSAPTLTPSGDYDVVNIVGDGTGIEEELHEYVEPLSLGCVFKGFLFQNGESFRRGCDACYCRDGRAECVAVKCNAPKPGYECIIVNRGKPKSCCPQYRCKKTRGPKKVGEESRLAALWANWKQQQLEQQGLRRGRRQ